MLDLDLLDGYSELFGDDHGHDGLGPGAEVACSHVQIDASVGKEFDDHGGRGTAATRKPEAACHANAPADVAAFFVSAAFLFASSHPKAFAPSSRHFSEARRRIRGISLPRLAERGDVLQSKLDRVHLDRLGQGIDHLLQGP